MKNKKNYLSLFLAFLCSDVALASPEDFPESKSGTFKPYLIQQNDGAMRGTFTPHNPGPMWKRIGVFTPTLRMVRVPLIIGAVSACFMVDRCFGFPFWNDRKNAPRF